MGLALSPEKRKHSAPLRVGQRSSIESRRPGVRSHILPKIGLRGQQPRRKHQHDSRKD
jgi:hypothetical protein